MSSKITIIGAGSVGSTIAYTLAHDEIASEIVLIDINKEKVEGEVMDIEQGTCFRSPVSLVAGDYADAKDSDIVIITSGIARKPGQTRIELTQTNVNILKSITPQIVKEAPDAKYIIVSNPVDIMTYVFTKISGLPENQIMGSGTILDTARLRYGLSEHFKVAQGNIHAYVFGEHGDTSFIPWTGAYISGLSTDEYYEEMKAHGKDVKPLDKEAMLEYVQKSGAYHNHSTLLILFRAGTEAVMSAIRVARGYTGKNKIIKFAGCYHGHSDAMLVSAGSGVMTSGVPDSAGVPKGCTEDTMLAAYNDLGSVETLFQQADGQVAAVIVEAVGANMGVVPPREGFLQGLRALCDQYHALLIFDEVITGFRLAFGGAAQYFGVTPDLVTYGKIIGAGMPVGAYGGRRDVMELVAPAGKVYQAGTLSGNPVAMAAGLTQLKYLYDHQEIYTELEKKGELLYGGIGKIVKEKGLNYQMNHVGSLGSLFFTGQPVVDYVSAKSSDTVAFAEYFKKMLNMGIHMAPSQFEAMFLSAAHTDEIIMETLDAVKLVL